MTTPVLQSTWPTPVVSRSTHRLQTESSALGNAAVTRPASTLGYQHLQRQTAGVNSVRAYTGCIGHFCLSASLLLAEKGRPSSSLRRVRGATSALSPLS